MTSNQIKLQKPPSCFTWALWNIQLHQIYFIILRFCWQFEILGNFLSFDDVFGVAYVLTFVEVCLVSATCFFEVLRGDFHSCWEAWEIYRTKRLLSLISTQSDDALKLIEKSSCTPLTIAKNPEVKILESKPFLSEEEATSYYYISRLIHSDNEFAMHVKPKYSFDEAHKRLETKLRNISSRLKSKRNAVRSLIQKAGPTRPKNERYQERLKKLNEILTVNHDYDKSEPLLPSVVRRKFGKRRKRGKRRKICVDDGLTKEAVGG